MLDEAELVLPAGTLEKLQTAVRFGCDAVYTASHSYGLRAYAGNLSMPELQEGLLFAHSRMVKVYVAVNVMAHNEDIESMPAYLEQLAGLGIDGIIVSDLGVIKMARQYCPDIPLTISTQANVSNYASVQFYEDLGVKRIVLSRELTLDEIVAIKSRVQVELEMFVHGSMCVAYSGRCLLSYYMTGRSANRGACAHPCRYKYHMTEEKRPGQFFPIEEDDKGVYLMNSKDLCLLPNLPDLLASGVKAFKVEGRMKSPLYVATVASIYHQAMNACKSNNMTDFELALPDWMQELSTVSPRPFTDGFIHGPDDGMIDFYKQEPPIRREFCAMIMDYDELRGQLRLEQRSNFGPDEKLEIFQPDGSSISMIPGMLYDRDGMLLDRARHPLQEVFMPFDKPVETGSILMRRRCINDG